MKAVGIATDSHSGITLEEAKKLGIMMLPMPFYVEDECFYEGISINRAEFFAQMNNGKRVSTSQQSPEAVMELWREGRQGFFGG